MAACGTTVGSMTQVSLLPPPWELLTTREPSFKATRVSPPCGHVGLFAGQDEGPQVEVAGHDPPVAERRGRWTACTIGWAM